MLKTVFGVAPQEEPDGSFRPSRLALKLGTAPVTDYRPVSYDVYRGARSRILVLFTEEKNLAMANGRAFSTGNHPVEALVPMLHLRRAGFDFDVVTPTGRPVVFEEWALPTADDAVMGLHADLRDRFAQPTPLSEALEGLDGDAAHQIAAVFIPGGHGALIGLPEDERVGALLRWAHDRGRLTISICHGPGALLATTLGDHDFPYAGYEMAVFPDTVDRQAPWIGYLPGPMPWHLGERLAALGAQLANTKADDTCCIDRDLITGASPAASNKLGRLAAEALLSTLSAMGL